MSEVDIVILYYVNKTTHLTAAPIYSSNDIFTTLCLVKPLNTISDIVAWQHVAEIPWYWVVISKLLVCFFFSIIYNQILWKTHMETTIAHLPELFPPFRFLKQYI